MSSARHLGALERRARDALLGAYANGAASGIHALLTTLRTTCALEVDAPERLRRDEPVVFAYWHENAMAGFVTLLGLEGRPFSALCHPAWYLRQWEILARRFGWRIVMGSTGHGGRAGADLVVADLAEGYSTFVCPDGPAGPPRVAKRGVLHMSAQSGVPILPLGFSFERAIALPSWDRMRLPIPGSRIRVEVGDPIQVGDDLDAANRALHAALGAEPRTLKV
jgi:lysophospholipid acyltransferase (LPLAT)-like uncharacterized protein